MRVLLGAMMNGPTHPPKSGVAADLVDLTLERGERAAAEASLRRAYDERRVLEVAGRIRPRRLVQHEHAEVGGDRVKAARVDDAGACPLGADVEALRGVVHEQDLARQVGVVRSGGGAGLDERDAVAAVLAERGGDCPRAAREG